MEHATLIHDLAIISATAAVVALIFHRFRQPIVVGYLLAGAEATKLPLADQRLDNAITRRRAHEIDVFELVAMTQIRRPGIRNTRRPR